MNKYSIEKIEEIKKLAFDILEKEVLSTEDIRTLDIKLTAILENYNSSKKYFKRLS